MERKDRINWGDVSDVSSSIESTERHLRQNSIPPNHIINKNGNKSKNTQLFRDIDQLQENIVYLVLLGVAFEANTNDISKYFTDIGAPIIKFIPQKNKRAFVVSLTKPNALIVGAVQTHILMKRQFYVKIDQQKHKLAPRSKTQISNDSKSKTSSTIQQSSFKSQESELMQAFKKAKISEQNEQIMKIVKLKNFVI